MIDLDQLSGVPDVDSSAAEEAAAHAQGAGVRWGAFADWVRWVAEVRGQFPPPPFRTVRVPAVGVDPAALPASLVYRPGLVAEALTVPSDVDGAFAAGRDWADRAADAGAEALLPVAPVDESTAAASATLVVLLAGVEPVWALGFDTDLDDEAWMRCGATVRDAAWRLRRAERSQLLAGVGEPRLAALVGLLYQAAARRTPVLLDGPVVAAAALLARTFDAGARAWWFAPHRDSTATERFALDALGLDPVAALGLRSAAVSGVGTLTLLPTLLAAVEAV